MKIINKRWVWIIIGIFVLFFLIWFLNIKRQTEPPLISAFLMIVSLLTFILSFILITILFSIVTKLIKKIKKTKVFSLNIVLWIMSGAIFGLIISGWVGSVGLDLLDKYGDQIILPYPDIEGRSPTTHLSYWDVFNCSLGDNGMFCGIIWFIAMFFGVNIGGISGLIAKRVVTGTFI